jgi:hypothetical protein
LAITRGKEAPRVMQDFLTHADECERIEKEALRLSSIDPETSPDSQNAGLLDELNVMLDTIGKFYKHHIRQITR